MEDKGKCALATIDISYKVNGVGRLGGGGGGGERPNEGVMTVGIGWAIMSSATSRFSGYTIYRVF